VRNERRESGKFLRTEVLKNNPITPKKIKAKIINLVF
jgi:hypothetical protein